MRTRLLHERRVKAKRIKIVKGAITAIDAALAKPGSKAALHKLRVARKQLTDVVGQESRELSQRLDTSKRTLAKLRQPTSFTSLNTY